MDVLLALLLLAPHSQEAGPTPIRYGEPEQLFEMADERIHESSGIALGLTDEGVLWTHNDSGDVARLFALDRCGALRAEVALKGAQAVDWEDMASFRRGEQAWLLVADTGDNRRARDVYQLYLLPEPELPEMAPEEPLTVEAETIAFRYPSGSENCEAVAVDPAGARILLATRQETEPRSLVYSLPLDGQAPEEALLAELVAELPLRLVTAMDLSPDGRRAVVVTYAAAHFYPRGPDESWGAAFGRAPTVLALPARPQGEAVCFDRDGRSLLLSSEKLPAPVHRIPALD